MRTLIKVVSALAAAITVAAVAAGCAATSSGRAGDASASDRPGMSSSDLPVRPKPSAPPATPSDPRSSAVAGRITAVGDDCREVMTDDGVMWSISGTAAIEVRVGDTVVARVAALGADDTACGTGRAARLVSIRVVAG